MNGESDQQGVDHGNARWPQDLDGHELRRVTQTECSELTKRLPCVKSPSLTSPPRRAWWAWGALLFAAGLSALAQTTADLIRDSFDDTDFRVNVGGVGQGFRAAWMEFGSSASEVNGALVLQQVSPGTVAGVRSADSFAFFNATGVEVTWLIHAAPLGFGAAQAVLGVYRRDLRAAPLPGSNAVPSISLVLETAGDTLQARLVVDKPTAGAVTRATWRLSQWNGLDTMPVRLRLNGGGYRLVFDPVFAPDAETPANPLVGTWDGFFDGQWTQGAVVTVAGRGLPLWAFNIEEIVVRPLEAPVTITFIRQPQNVTVDAGQTASFSVAATGQGTSASTFLYQWQRNGVAVADATNATFTTPPVTLADHGARYRCVVSLPDGAAEATSQEATLFIAGVRVPTVLMRSFVFRPERIVINPGDRVTWLNADVAVHTTTSDTGLWASPELARGATFSFTFTNAGVFRYHSALQRYMRGTVVVQSPPEVTLLSPRNGAIFVTPGLVTFRAEAADLDGQIAQVEFFTGTNLVGTVASPPFEFAWLNPPPGRYELRARATDDRGAWTASAPATFDVTPFVPAELGEAAFVPDAGFRLTLRGTTNAAYVIETASKLSPPPDWQPLVTNTLASGALTFTDTNALQSPRRFYRARPAE